MKQFKKISLTILFLCFSIFSFSQSKWTCFPNNDSLHFCSEKGTPTMLGGFSYIDNSIWMINYDGIYIYNGSKWSIVDYKKQFLHYYIRTWLVDSKHNVWIGFGGPPAYNRIHSSFDYGGISEYNGKRWINFPNGNLNIPVPHVFDSFEAANGDIWFVAQSLVRSNASVDMSYGINDLLQYSQGKWNTYLKKDVPFNTRSISFKPSGVICGIYQTSDKKIWFRLASGNLFYLENDKLIEADEKIGYNFSDQYLMTNYQGEWAKAFFDSKENLWLTDLYKGVPLAVYNNKIWKTFNPYIDLNRNFRNLGLFEMKDGSMRIVSAVPNYSKSGILIYKFDGVDKWSLDLEFRFDKKIKIDPPSPAVDTARNIWIVGNSGDLGVYDGHQFKWELQDKGLSMLFIDRQNRVWAANKEALYLKENDTWKNFDNISNVKGFLEDKSGAVWILTENNGLASYLNGKLETYTEKNGLLSSKIIQVYCTRDNSIWVITDKGMCKFNRN